jgi:hypothetical protein
MRTIKSLLYLLFGALCLVNGNAFATGVNTPAAGGGGAISIRESDGAPSIGTITGLIVTNGSLTDNGDGTATVATSGASTVTIGSSVVTGGTASSLLYVGAGPVLQQVSISGLVLGNGASAPTVYGGVTCTNQVLRILSAAGAGTCQTITSAYVDSSILVSGGALGTPSSGTLTNATGLPVAGISNLGANVGTFLVTPTGANFQTAVANYVEEPAGNGIITRTAADTITNRTITGTANEVSVANGDGAAGNPTLSLPASIDLGGKSVEIPNDVSLPGTCSVGQIFSPSSATTGQRLYLCEATNSWVLQGDGGGGGSIGGSTGATDNAILRADGTGGATLQSSGCLINDSGALTCTGGITAGTSGTGTLVLLEGTAPGAGTNAGEHNVYFDSADSKLKSHENGGSVQTYVRTADTVAVLNTSTSAELAGVLSDEIGTSGGFVRGTGSTLTNLTIAGTAIVFPDGTTQTFNPNATNSGLNVGAQAGDPSAPNNGDMHYNSTSNTFRCRENGAWKDCINSAAGTGDVTDVIAGAGIDVATPGGPQPTLTLNLATLVNSQTMWDGANASRTLTAAVTGTDPVITFSASSVDVTTGTLKQGGTAVATSDSTNTFTNKTYDAEGTGNALTIPRRIWLPAAGCNNATAGSIWDLPTTNAAVAACVTGTNTQKGVLDFADASNLSAQITWKLPSTWTGAVDLNVKWFTSATTGDVVWQSQTICTADAETDDPAFNTADAFAADTAKGTTLQTNDASDTGITMTGCAAGELLHLKIFRDSAHASDTLAATARLIGVELVIREAM